MRRFSAFLMIAALVAVLVPSAALAAKPPAPDIDTLLVQGYGTYASTGQCLLTVTVTWHGRAYEVEWKALSGNDTWEGQWGARLPKLSPAGFSFLFEPADLGDKVIYWQAKLLDRKGGVLGQIVETGTEDWTDPTTCPPKYYVLGTWNILG
jgi:hypothetical protein